MRVKLVLDVRGRRCVIRGFAADSPAHSLRSRPVKNGIILLGRVKNGWMVGGWSSEIRGGGYRAVRFDAQLELRAIKVVGNG